MKLSKRIISLVFAVMLISTFAIQAGATTHSYTGGRTGGCLFACFTTCEVQNEKGIALMEADPINGTSVEDHLLRPDMIVHYQDGLFVRNRTFGGPTNTGISSQTRTGIDGLIAVEGIYYINSVQVYTVRVTDA